MPASAKFFAHGWILRTANGDKARITCDAYITTDTFADIFVATFFILGYLGTEPTNVWGQFGAWMGNADRATVAARFFTVLYFAFFILMPWYTALDKSKPVPDRVTM